MLGNLEEAQRILPINSALIKERIGETNFEYAKILSYLGILYQNTEKPGKANRVYAALIENLNYNINYQLVHLPRKVQLIWKEQMEVFKDQINSFFLNKPVPAKAFAFNSQFKAMTVRDLNTLYKDENQYQEWLDLRQKIARELSRPQLSQSEQLEHWEREILILESEMQAKHNLYLDQQLSWEKLKKYLKADEVAIDFVRFKLYHPIKTDSVYYVAYIVDPVKEIIQQVTLFEERKLGKILKNNQTRRADYITYLYNINDRGVVVEGANIYELIWKPLMPYLKNKKTIHFSPVGHLHKFNHNAILFNQDSTLIDKFDLRQYTTLRSLLLPKKEYTNFNYVLVGGVDYNASITIKEKNDTLSNITPSVNSGSRASAVAPQLKKWEYLKWTKKEVEKIDAMFQQTGKWKGAILSGKNIPEENVKQRRSKNNTDMRVTHFASHGFFFPDRYENEIVDLPYFVTSKDPMLRSGLVLSGANRAWLGEKIPEGKEDGILTAYEIQHLNLSNTELVVLSACETGLGEIRGSEGVFGLQRACKLAGVQYIIMSLWQVPDKATQNLMTAFYKYWLLEEMEIRTAFRQAQKDMKELYEEPYFWAGFVFVE